MKQKKRVPQSFHKYWLALIKRETGASFCGWEQNPEGNFLKIIVGGGAIYCEIGGSVEDVTSESYAGLLKDLLDETRPQIGGIKTEKE